MSVHPRRDVISVAVIWTSVTKSPYGESSVGLVDVQYAVHQVLNGVIGNNVIKAFFYDSRGMRGCDRT